MKDHNKDDLESIYPISSLKLEVNETDPDYLEALEAEEPKVLDPELYNLLGKIKLPEPSDKVYERFMKSYDKVYRYKILRRKIKIKIQKLKDFILEHLPGRLELAFASLALLAILGGMAYYQYGNFKSINQGNLISNQQTPKTNIRAIASPSPTPNIAKEVTPKIQENNKDNVESPSDNINVAKKQKIENKIRENINTLYKKENNKKDHIKDTTKDNIKDEALVSKTYPINITIPTTRTIELINNNMVYIGSFSEDDFDENKKKWLEELHNCLVKEIPSVKSDLEWEVVSAENATISLQIDDKNESVVIVNSKAEDIWRMKITDYIKDSPRVVADRIIQQLQKDITIFSQK